MTVRAKTRSLTGEGSSLDACITFLNTDCVFGPGHALCRCREVQNRFDWLDDKLVRDAKGHRPQHQVCTVNTCIDYPLNAAHCFCVQMYDPRTVTVPAEAFKKLSGDVGTVCRDC